MEHSFKKVIAINMNGEDLKPVPDYEDYFVSLETGKIWSTKFRKYKEMKQGTQSDGYKKCMLYKDKQGKNFMVHRLVMAAYLGTWEPLHGMEIHHKIRNPELNRIDNLEIVTRLGQFDEITRKNMSLAKKGMKSPNAKLTESDVQKIRDEYNAGTYIRGKFIKEKMKVFNVSHFCIYAIIENISWKRLKADVV